MNSEENDFEFFLGEKVSVGTQDGVVSGQATFAYRPDEYMLSLIDDDGLPAERWFAGHMISKTRKN